MTTGRAQNTKQLILQQIHLGPSGNRQHGQTGQFEESLIQELLIKAWSGFRETSEGQDSTPGLAAKGAIATHRPERTQEKSCGFHRWTYATWRPSRRKTGGVDTVPPFSSRPLIAHSGLLLAELNRSQRQGSPLI